MEIKYLNKCYVKLKINTYLLILVARASQELMLFMKTHEVNPLKGMLLPAIQVPTIYSLTYTYCSDLIKKCFFFSFLYF